MGDEMPFSVMLVRVTKVIPCGVLYRLNTFVELSFGLTAVGIGRYKIEDRIFAFLQTDRGESAAMLSTVRGG